MKRLDETKLRELHAAGATVTDIAKALECCVPTVNKTIKSLGLVRGRTPQVEDLSGQRFSRLVALEYVKNDKFGKALWRVRCDCGKEKIINASSMKAGLTTSCGCYKHE